VLTLQAQQGNTFFLMHAVPQSNLLNPAVQIDCRYFIGIPVLASAHLSYSNTAFTYNDLAGTDTWNIEGIFDQMHPTDLYTAEAWFHPISLGYRRKAFYYTFNIAEKVHGYQTIPRDVAEMTVHGNGPFVGDKASFNGLRPGGYHTREYSLGISKVMSPYLTAGIRAKLLFGKANLTSGRSKMSLATAEDNFSILLDGDYTLNSSFPFTLTEDSAGNIDGIEMEEIVPLDYMLNRGNPGFSVDLGAIYRYDERITLSASLLDLGFVRWRTDLNNVSGEGEFAYGGTDLSTVLVSMGFLEEMVDSLMNSLEVTNTRDPYTYFLPTQLYLGGSYRLSDAISLGAVNRNVIYRSKLHSSFTISAQADLADRLLAAVSWSYLNNTVRNVGLGLAWHGKGIQFHAVTDNLLGFFYPFDTRTLNLRFGVGMMLGCPRDKREEQMEGLSRMLPGGECPYPERPEKMQRQRERAVRKINSMR
jgi:hypothetical protein